MKTVGHSNRRFFFDDPRMAVNEFRQRSGGMPTPAPDARAPPKARVGMPPTGGYCQSYTHEGIGISNACEITGEQHYGDFPYANPRRRLPPPANSRAGAH